MSGSGGGDYLPTPTGGPCERLKQETAVQSPNPDVIARLSVRDELDVSLGVQGQAKTIFVRAGADIAGTLVISGQGRLIECLEQGYTYVAVVKALSGADCVVEIRPR
jgi:hypothetical protein